MKKASDAKKEQIKVPAIEPQSDNPSQEVSEAQGELYSAPIIPLVLKAPTHIPATKAKNVNLPSVFPQVPSQLPPSSPLEYVRGFEPDHPSSSHTAPR